MSTGTLSPQKEREKQTFFDFEHRCQRTMDRHYQQRGHKIVSRKGNKEYDLILLVNGQIEDRVEEKFRNNARGDDVLVELIQDAISGDMGWFYHTRCQHLHYVIAVNAVPKFYYRIFWEPFKRWFLNIYLRGKLDAIISNKGYGLTLNIAVPVASIPATMIVKYEIEPTQDAIETEPDF